MKKSCCYWRYEWMVKEVNEFFYEAMSVTVDNLS